MTRRIPATARRDGRLLESFHVARTSVQFEPSDTIFAQGDRSATVMYITKGRVKLSVASPGGRTAVVAILHAGAFFGEGALAGQRFRRSTAEAVTCTTIAVVRTAEMRQRLHAERALSDWFRAQMLARNIRIEHDLVENAFNGCESRLARALLLLAGADERQSLRYPMPKISRKLLAEMTEMTHSRVDVLMNNFRKRGFLERHSQRDGGLQVHRSLLSVVLHN